MKFFALATKVSSSRHPQPPSTSMGTLVHAIPVVASTAPSAAAQSSNDLSLYVQDVLGDPVKTPSEL